MSYSNTSYSNTSYSNTSYSNTSYSNNTDYPLKIKHRIDEFEEKYDKEQDNEFIQYYQYIVKEYLTKGDTRGLLVFHSTGVGKSITAAAIADHYRKYDKDRKIIILLPKSLQSNFENNVKKYMRNNPHNTNHEKSPDFIEETLDLKYNFISLNASNMFIKLSKIKKALYEEDLDKNFDKNLGEFNTKIKGLLENSLLIVDEFHNLSNAITNGSKNAVNLYNTIMNTKDIKLVFLTGTPIINNPFEIVPTFNLLKGYIRETNNKQKYTLFPENQIEFSKFFLKDRKNINNKQKFQNRIFGLVSYYGDFYFDKKNKKEFPEQKATIIERVPMSLYQFGRYQETREIEMKEEANKFKKSNSNEFFTTKEESKSSSSYRIRSRQVSNYFIPEYALTFKNSRTSVTKHLNKIKEEDIKNLDKYSPKFKKIIENINKHPDQSGVVYSEFVAGEGLALFAKTLESRGYLYWEKTRRFVNNLDSDYLLKAEKSMDDDADDVEAESEAEAEGEEQANKKSGGYKKEKTYALITGDIPVLERQNILDVFNSKENMRGGVISLLLISKSGAEGLNLKYVRHIHVMEPFWNYARIEQIIARGVRFQSHTLLSPNERNVQPYIYISIYPKNLSLSAEKKKERTTDEEILYGALVGKKLRDEFELAIIEASIDCSVNYNKIEKALKNKFSCYLCAPTNSQLYELDLYKEINSPNPCKSLSSKKEIKAQEITVSINNIDTKFYYTRSNINADNPYGEIKIYQYSDEIGGYILLKKSHPYYSDIVKSILNL